MNKREWKLDQWGSIVDCNGDTVKIVGVALPGFNNQEALDNRNLLLAAPELLEALEEMVYWFGRYPEIVPNMDALESYKTTVKKAKQAIAKAKGE